MLDIMENAALNAGWTILANRSQVHQIDSLKDIVTSADLLSENSIIEFLKTRIPNVASYSEEAGGSIMRKGEMWIIDPIDGTKNFYYGNRDWGISIAYVLDGMTQAGVVYLPDESLLFSASRSWEQRYGTNVKNLALYHRSSQTLRLTSERKLHQAYIWLDWGKEEHEGGDHFSVIELIEKLDQATSYRGYPKITNSATYSMMSLAMGRCDGYVFLKPEPFDIAAACLIVERASGIVTDQHGNAWSPFSKSIVASSNQFIHDELLKLFKD
jgi:myo-inositol-1(or 4)-monophosphatase